MRARLAGRPMPSALSAAFLAVAAALLAACAPTALQRPTAASPSVLQDFDISGRLSARRGTEGFTANFQWRHRGAQDDLELVSPLGQTIAVLAGDGDRVRLQASDGRVLAAESWTELTQQGLGWPLPVDGLKYWIQGVPRPDAAFTEEPGEGGQAALLRQDGWTILYQAYMAVGESSRPSRIAATYPDVDLRLVIDRWQ